MAKSLSDRIASRTSLKKPTHGLQNRAAFLAVRVDVKQALADGWPIKVIWETLHEEQKVTFSYQAFRGYVNRLVLGTAAAEMSAAVLDPKVDNMSPTPAVKRPKRQGGFVFNSIGDPKELF